VDDLGSTNGTFVNGERVTRSSLKEGDKLGVGRVELVVSRE
jgi:pSer/pThr/pTyr-binding forkhead associated (FHA) protein